MFCVSDLIHRQTDAYTTSSTPSLGCHRDSVGANL